MVKEYEIARVAGLCAACGKEFQPGQAIVAALKEDQEQLVREDFCPGCWEARDAAEAPGLFGHWRTTAPRPQEKKRQFVDDDVLVSFFHRLEGAEEPAKVSFRFVLALVLMRKRILSYEGMTKLPDGRETWTMRLKGAAQPCTVVNPRLDEDRIAEVSRQLGQVIPGAAETD